MKASENDPFTKMLAGLLEEKSRKPDQIDFTIYRRGWAGPCTGTALRTGRFPRFPK